jgi:DNA-binding transcriptional MerR regulator/methylmalonyl-CoA mutase cobalamin-binding subunit
LTIVAMENETGLTRDVVRKWEARYGFTRPERDENGDRVYPAEQVACLRLIRRLLGGGLRPGKIVGLDQATLEQLVAQMAPPASKPSDASGFMLEAFEALSRHDLVRLSGLLRGRLYRQGLSLFVRHTVAALTVAVGEAWSRGEIRVFEEHLFTQAVSDVLQDAIRTVTDYSASPRILLTTPPGELHTIGLLMATAELSLLDACCVGLGAQAPAVEIAEAARACRIDVVGLSFSVAYPPRDSTQFLQDLRPRLDPRVEIWAGGHGVSRLRRIPGVLYERELDELAKAVRAWRRRHENSARGADRCEPIRDAP